jgi:hypothetical protein
VTPFRRLLRRANEDQKGSYPIRGFPIAGFRARNGFFVHGGWPKHSESDEVLHRGVPKLSTDSSKETVSKALWCL